MSGCPLAQSARAWVGPRLSASLVAIILVAILSLSSLSCGRATAKTSVAPPPNVFQSIDLRTQEIQKSVAGLIANQSNQIAVNKDMQAQLDSLSKELAAIRAQLKTIEGKLPK